MARDPAEQRVRLGYERGSGTVYGEIPDTSAPRYTLSFRPVTGGAMLGLWGAF